MSECNEEHIEYTGFEITVREFWIKENGRRICGGWEAKCGAHVSRHPYAWKAVENVLDTRNESIRRRKDE